MSAALVGEGMLSGQIQDLLDMMASREILEFVRSQKLIGSLLKKMKLVLISASAVLDDAEEKQYVDPSVKNWLDDLKDVIYCTEDLFDEILTEDLQRKLDAESQTKRNPIWKFSSLGKLVDSLKNGIEKKMELILERLERIVKWKDPLGLESIAYDMEKSPRTPPTDFTTSLADRNILGREHDKEEIVNSLLSGHASERLSVIPIVGMGGMGKTTLAQLVFEDRRVIEHFDLRGWAFVSDDFDMFRLTKEIFKSLSSQPCDIKELNLLQVRLQNCLRGKRFLLVLDDVWNENSSDWKILRSAFEGAAKGSGVIVTTRSRNVAMMMSSVVPHDLLPLNDEESWLLFATFAFGNNAPDAPPELEAIGRQIVRNCGGLPLAIVLVGNLLRSKLFVEDWREWLRQLSSRESDILILPVIKVSYDHLPAHLKRCFAYCSIFPPGYEFEKEKLVLLWMGEGLLQQTHANYRMEDIGDQYFNKLLSMSLFEQSSSNKSRFRMHDLISDLANYVSGRFCFRLENDHPTGLTASTRYLSLFGCKNNSPEMFEAINNARYLRTFLPLDHISCHLNSNILEKLSKLQFLRVLSLSHYQIDGLPNSIGDLKHLRYIDLSHTTIKELPESVCTLYNLQTLILLECHSLTELPESMWGLINLRHLDISGTALHEMPKEMSRLKNLQTLPYFVAGKRRGSTVKELGGLPYLHGTLHISELQNVVSLTDVAEARLAKKACLDELTLEWDDNTADSEFDRDVLGQLVPHTNLKMLSIIFYGGTRFQNWVGDISFSKMRFLCLSNCKFCFSLPPLGQLPSLEVLIIEGMHAVMAVGDEFYGVGKPFQSLKTLTFEGMLHWEDWVPFKDGVEYPCLQELCIRRCPKLKGQLPKKLPYVEKVEISESQELVNALMMAASSQKTLLHYHDKVLFVSDNKVGSFSKQMTDLKYEDVTESSLPKTHGAAETHLHSYDKVLSTTEDEVASTSEDMTEITIMSYNFPSTSSENVIKNSNTKNEGALKSSLPTQTTNSRRDEADVLKDTFTIQDGLQDLSPSVSKKVSEISQLKNLSPYLQSLKIEGCDAEFISAQTINCFSLQHMYIINCCSLKSFPGGHPPTSMKSLYIQNCKKLEFLPHAERTHQYAVLEHLCIGSSCDSMESFPLGFFPKLSSLSIWDCANLVSLSMPEGIQKDLRFLESLEIRDCPKLASFPGGLPTPKLKSIWFSNCNNLKELPDQFYTLNSLRSMFINNCPELVSLPEKGLPSNLILLSITSCNKLMLGKEWGLYELHHLSRLEIEGGCGNVVSFPEELLPSNLNSLRISRLLNLKFLDKGLQHLTTLKALEISYCNRLRSLPKEGLPSSLSFLCIKECTLLKPKLQNKAGKDWSKIAHISRIEID